MGRGDKPRGAGQTHLSALRPASQAQRAKPFSYVYFYANLSYLQSLGLIALVSTKVGRSYTNRVLLTCESAIVESIYKLRFEPG